MRKNIVISGASSGLGAGMARRFASQGRDLALCARRLDRLDALADELRAANPGIRVVTRALDVNDTDDVFAAFKEFRSELGGIDRVVVNAGIGKGQPIGTGYFQANAQTALTNVVGTLAQCEAAVDIFREQNSGHLVLMSSASALRGMPRNMTAYAASKAAVSALGEGIRADLLSTPIKVSTLLPGYIESEMSGNAAESLFRSLARGRSRRRGLVERVGTAPTRAPRRRARPTPPARHSRSADQPESSSATATKTPLMTGAEHGVRALTAAIERERPKAYIPALPWMPLSLVLRIAPIGVINRFV